MILTFLFLWGICGLVAAVIASDKGRSAVGWFVVTLFFLGPLGPGFALLAEHGDVQKAKLVKARAQLKAAQPPATVQPIPPKAPKQS